nr:hypothetical protein [Tanacetum cinerariifolium]
MYPSESLVGKTGAGNGCSSTGITSSSGGINSGYTGSGTNLVHMQVKVGAQDRAHSQEMVGPEERPLQKHKGKDIGRSGGVPDGGVLDGSRWEVDGASALSMIIAALYPNG